MGDQLSVLHVINEFEDGSIARIVERIISAAGAENYQMHVGAVKPGGSFSGRYETLNARISQFWQTNQDHAPIHLQLKDYIRANQIQIVHSHTPRTITEVWRSQRGNHPSQIKHLATKHLMTKPGDRKFGLVYWLVDLFSLYLPDKVVAVSKTMAMSMMKLPGIKHERICSIPNGIPCLEYDQPHLRAEARKEMGLSDELIVFGFNGRLSRVKRLDDMINAFSIIHQKFPFTRLVLAGEGDERSRLQEHCSKLGIGDSVIWVGFTSQIPRLLAAIDIYIQTSSNEGLSLSILEAMAAGKPVITTRVDSTFEIIQDGVTGVVVPVGSVDQISNGMQFLITHPDQQKAIARNGQLSTCQNFDVQQMADSYLNVYQAMLEDKGQNEREIKHLYDHSSNQGFIRP